MYPIVDHPIFVCKGKRSRGVVKEDEKILISYAYPGGFNSFESFDKKLMELGLERTSQYGRFKGHNAVMIAVYPVKMDIDTFRGELAKVSEEWEDKEWKEYLGEPAPTAI